MKKIIVLLCIFLIFCGCGGGNRYLPPEGEKISSVSDTAKCKFIKTGYCETRPSTMIHYVQLNTYNAGGDSYKIISTNNQIVMGTNIMMINFEIYKCKP